MWERLGGPGPCSPRESFKICASKYPGPRGFLFILSFLFGNLRREALNEAPSRERRKPLVRINENLTFMLAQHLTAVKDVIFF